MNEESRRLRNGFTVCCLQLSIDVVGASHNLNPERKLSTNADAPQPRGIALRAQLAVFP